MEYTNREIAENYRLWMEYVDTSGIDSEEKFNQMTTEEKLKIMVDCGFTEEI